MLLAVITAAAFSQTTGDAILGEWLSPKKDSRILIFRQGNKYYGKITWGTGSSPKDEKNPKPELRSRELLGLVILNHFEFDGDDTWEKGDIYDPREGKTYSCKMTLKDPNRLSIRGYIGLSMFGRSEIWTRYRQ